MSPLHLIGGMAKELYHLSLTNFLVVSWKKRHKNNLYTHSHCALDFDLLTPKTIIVFHTIRAIIPESLKALDEMFTLKVPVNLTFDSLTPKAVSFFHVIRATIL